MIRFTSENHSNSGKLGTFSNIMKVFHREEDTVDVKWPFVAYIFR